MVLVIADIAYTLQTNGASLPGGDWTDPIYLIAAACLGAMLWQPSAERIRASTGFEGWRELVVPALFAAVMIGLFAMQYFSATSGLSTVLWAATMIAVIVRLADQRAREQGTPGTGQNRPPDRARQPRRDAGGPRGAVRTRRAGGADPGAL